MADAKPKKKAARDLAVDSAEVIENPVRMAAVLRAILESPKELVIFALDREYRYLAFNANHAATMQRIWNAKIALGVSMFDYIGREDDRAKAKANFDRALGGESFRLEEPYGDENLERRWYEDCYSPIYSEQGEVIGLTLFLNDITEQRKDQLELEEYRQKLEGLVEARGRELSMAHAQLLHAQKLESLGVLAGGIAHDFNNLLVGILGCSELAMEELPPDSNAYKLVKQSLQASRKAAELTGQMLAYTGRAPFAVEPLDVSGQVEEQHALLRAMVPANVSLEFQLAKSLPMALADSARLQQVVVNLITNSSEAIGADSGTISVRTNSCFLDSAALAGTYLDDELESGEFVGLTVTDDGVGMDEETRMRIFDPFFTTKRSGRGLGLASVLGIVRGHSGAIRVRSSENGGTTFEIFLPVAVYPKASLDGLEVPEGATSNPIKKLALIVDDEPQVRSVLRLMLRGMQTDCVESSDGLSAMQQVHKIGSKLDFVVLDLTMPHQGGKATLGKIREVNPRLPVLILSGYSAQTKRLDFVAADSHASFLQKPFSRKELKAALGNLLET